MTSTAIKKRIEVLVDAPLLRKIRSIAEECGLSGYTVIPTLEGSGHGGRWFDERVTGGAGSKVIFLTITGEEKAQAFIDALTPLLEPYSLIVTRSDVEVIRSGKF